MNRTKWIVLMIVAALLLGGCGTTTGPASSAAPSAGQSAAEATAAPTEAAPAFNKTGYPIVSEPITLKIAGEMSELATTWEGNLQLDYLTRLTGIKFEPEGVSADAWAEQKSLMLASDSLPDLFVSASFTSAELLEYGSEGQLIALNDLIDQYGENIKAAFKQFPMAKALVTSGDGKMYSVPYINQVVRDMHNRYWIDKKWIDTLKLKVPTTLDELYTVLAAFKDQDANGNGDAADEIPLSGIEGASSYDGLILNALGVNVKGAEYNITATADGKVYCANTSDAYKEYLKYMRKLYAEKILDNDIFVQTADQLSAKAQKNIIGGCGVSAMYITANKEIGYDYMQIDALTSALNQTKMVTASSGISTGGAAITKNNKYPEATLRLLDFFFTEDGGKVAYVGEENVGWKWIDKAAGTWDKVTPEGYETAEDFRNAKAIVGVAAWGGWERTEFNAGQGSDNAKWLNKMSQEGSQPYFVTAFPKSSLSLSAEDSTKIATIETDVGSYVAEARARFISGEDDIDATWAAYVENVKKMGIDTVVTVYQKYYDAFQANMK